MDWHRVALPLIEDRSASRVLQTLRDAMQRMVLMSPLPARMSGVTTAEPAPLDAAGSNLVDWLALLLESHPSAYLTVVEQLQQVMPDLAQFRFERLGRDERALMVKFAAGQSEFELPFERLSDGEKCFFLAAILLAANRWDGPLIAFWDEPDNFVAPHETASFVVALKRSFAKHGGQWIATSHNVQTVLNFAMDATWVVARASHLEPTRTRCVEEIDLGDSDLVNRMVSGDLDAWL
jgi:predicted ATPase